jgi:alpha-galactosidase
LVVVHTLQVKIFTILNKFEDHVRVFMPPEVKVSLIGAGSAVFTSSFVRAICNIELSREASVTLSLIDRDEHRLDMINSIASKTVDYYSRKRPGLEVKVEKTTDRRKSFEGADFALQTVSVGGVDAARLDGSIPKNYGIYQVIGDTVGPGGLLAGLRQIPVLVQIAQDLQEVAPGALLLNFSNPTTPIVRAVERETKANIVGMCTSILGLVMDVAILFKVRTDQVALREAGINHFSWVTGMEVDGVDSRGRFVASLPEQDGRPPFDEYSLSLKLNELFGLFPVPGDRHIAEFFPRVFLSSRERKKYGIPITPDRTIYSEERRGPVLDAMERAASGSMPIEEYLHQHFLEEESVESARVIEAVATGRTRLLPGVNLGNDGLLVDVPSWGVVEVPAMADSSGVHPVGHHSLPRSLTGMVNERVGYYETLVDAALDRDRDLALQAMLLDGYVDSEETAGRLLDEMLGAEARWLPEEWAKLAERAGPNR